MSPVKNHIAAWRERRGMTQTELGDAIGVTHATISRIEGGGIDLKESRLHAIAQALRVAAPVLIAAGPDGYDGGLPADVLTLWNKATPAQKQQIRRIIKALLET